MNAQMMVTNTDATKKKMQMVQKMLRSGYVYAIIEITSLSEGTEGMLSTTA